MNRVITAGSHHGVVLVLRGGRLGIIVGPLPVPPRLRSTIALTAWPREIGDTWSARYTVTLLTSAWAGSSKRAT